MANAPAGKGQGSWHTPLRLQTSPALQEDIPTATQEKMPVYLSGNELSGAQDTHAVLQGNAQLRRGPMSIRADRMEYTPATSTARAQGHVQINQAGDIYQGRELEVNINTYEGYFDDVQYRLLQNGAHGQAKRVDFRSKDVFDVEEGNYTTCERAEHDPDWTPAWRIRARTLHLDRQEDVGIARNATLEFMGVPVLPVPYLSFPLSDKRKTGLLTPTLGVDSVSGLQYEQPFYWNIAPNRDATLYTTLLARRGVNVGGEFRYLERTFSGEIGGRYMPNDSLRDRDRWSYTYKHNHRLPAPVGAASFNLNLNRVSDDDYWRDFTRGYYRLTGRLLNSQANLNWRHQDVSLRMRAQKWQTLQDVDSVIIPPYDMLPQIKLSYTPRQVPGGFDVSAELDATRFSADEHTFTRLRDGDRFYGQLRVQRPFLASYGFITPSFQLHSSHYRLDANLQNASSSHSFTIPTISLDSGLFFERDTNFWGRNVIQTLEPRAFYTYTPFRDQSMLPMYDSAELDFTFASIYSPNSFVGNDRFADNHLLTLGLTSKLIDPATGGELIRAGIAQRLRFKDQNVTAPGRAAVTDRWSDILVGGVINWTPRWTTNGVLQYNYKDRRSVRYTLSGQYRPGPYRVLSAGYRMKRDTSKHVDVSWQWPLAGLWGQSAAAAKTPGSGGRWYTVGRLNYSLDDKRLVDSLIGFEYDGCCWVGRVVVQRLQNSFDTANTRLLLQIELGGLSRINVGSDPLSSLRNNISGYQSVRDFSNAPSSRFDNYDQEPVHNPFSAP